MKNLKLISIFVLLTTLVNFAYSQNSEMDIETVYYQVIAVNASNEEIISESNIIEVHPSLNIYLPNTFTPNNDGLNDTFGPLGYGIKSMSFKIFDRWGNLLFETTNPKEQWDGTYNGKTLQSGTYVYLIEASGHEGQVFNKKGTVSLIKL
jgi:gliding motility-associated-like protein